MYLHYWARKTYQDEKNDKTNTYFCHITIFQLSLMPPTRTMRINILPYDDNIGIEMLSVSTFVLQISLPSIVNKDATILQSVFLPSTDINICCRLASSLILILLPLIFNVSPSICLRIPFLGCERNSL